MSTATAETYDAAKHELIPKAEAAQIRENAKAAAAIRFKYESYCADAAPAAIRRAELQALHDEAAAGNSVISLNLRLAKQHDDLVSAENEQLRKEETLLRGQLAVLLDEAEQMSEATTRAADALERREQEHHKEISVIQSVLDGCTAKCRALQEDNDELARKEKKHAGIHTEVARNAQEVRRLKAVLARIESAKSTEDTALVAIQRDTADAVYECDMAKGELQALQDDYGALKRNHADQTSTLASREALLDTFQAHAKELSDSLHRYTVAAKAVRTLTATAEEGVLAIKKAVHNKPALVDLCDEVQRQLETSTRLLKSL
jgi:hypothetical protein